MNINRINDISSKYTIKKTNSSNEIDSNFDKMFLEETMKESSFNNTDTYMSNNIYSVTTNIPINTTYSIKSSKLQSKNVSNANIDHNHIINELSKNIAINVHSHITESRVSELKSSIQNKSYFVDSEELADKILGKV